MANVFTYSFMDTTVTVSHPQYGSYSAYGSGIGSLSIRYANDVTSHDVAADLSVVVSKSVKKNGTVDFNVLQASDFNNWLKGLTSYLENADTSDFALATINIKNNSTGDNIICSGVSHQKRADNELQDTAQRRTWTFMCANISNQ